MLGLLLIYMFNCSIFLKSQAPNLGNKAVDVVIKINLYKQLLFELKEVLKLDVLRTPCS